MKIRIAELNIEIFARYPLIQTLCGNYLADFEKADISVCVSEQEIREEVQNAKEPITAEIAEFACAYRAQRHRKIHPYLALAEKLCQSGARAER